jgi:hypothetical protein
MIQEITQYDFLKAFRQSESSKDEFSYEALIALHNYYEELEESIGKKIPFDMDEICCEWTEYDSAIDAIKDCRVCKLEDLSDMTTVIELKTGHILVGDF